MVAPATISFSSIFNGRYKWWTVMHFTKTSLHPPLHVFILRQNKAKSEPPRLKCRNQYTLFIILWYNISFFLWPKSKSFLLPETAWNGIHHGQKILVVCIQLAISNYLQSPHLYFPIIIVYHWHQHRTQLSFFLSKNHYNNHFLWQSLPPFFRLLLLWPVPNNAS